MARRMKDDDQEFEDLSSYSSSREYKKRRKNRGSRTVLKCIAGFLCVLMILAGSGMIYIGTDLVGDLTTTSITKDPEKLGISEPDLVLDNSITNIALFGLDSRSDSFEGQSDVIMILSIDNSHGKIKEVSILRDSRVPIEGESLDGGYIDWVTKINAAYELGGPELAIRTLNLNFDVRIEDYVTINFANMAAIVDAFGGVEIEVTAEEVREINKNLWALNAEVEELIESDQANGTYAGKEYPTISHDDYFKDVNGTVDIEYGTYEGGTFLLNGNQAVAYGRIREIDSDFVRVRRQQEVLQGLIDKLKTMSYSEYPGVIRQMMPMCETSLDLGDIVSFTPILTKDFTVEAIAIPDINYETDLYDGKLDDDVWYLVYDTVSAAERISAFIYEESSPYWEKYGNTSVDETTDSTTSGLTE